MLCNICYDRNNSNKIICCKNKYICDICIENYNKNVCPFCKQHFKINKQKNYIIIKDIKYKPPFSYLVLKNPYYIFRI